MTSSRFVFNELCIKNILMNMGEFFAGEFSSGEYSAGEFTTGEFDEGGFSAREFYDGNFPRRSSPSTRPQ